MSVPRPEPVPPPSEWLRINPWGLSDCYLLSHAVVDLIHDFLSDSKMPVCPIPTSVFLSVQNELWIKGIGERPISNCIIDSRLSVRENVSWNKVSTPRLFKKGRGFCLPARPAIIADIMLRHQLIPNFVANPQPGTSNIDGDDLPPFWHCWSESKTIRH